MGNFSINEQTFLKDLCKLFCSDYLYEPKFFSMGSLHQITERYLKSLEIEHSRIPAMSWQFAVNLLGHLNRFQFLTCDAKIRLPSVEELNQTVEDDLSIISPNIAWRSPYVGMSDVGIRFLESCHRHRFVRGTGSNYEDYLRNFYPHFLEKFPVLMGFSNLHQWLKSGKVKVNVNLLGYQRNAKHLQRCYQQFLQLSEGLDILSASERTQAQSQSVETQLPVIPLSGVIPFLEICRQEGAVLDDVWGYAENAEDMNMDLDGRMKRVALFSQEEFAEYRQLLRREAIETVTIDYLIRHFGANPDRLLKNGINHFYIFACSGIFKTR
ncbi:hypothetical protein MMG00_04085 [Ignatzschineria rhizosphaerae]|uniref:Uncharacterized protein n=1 Tax=Ignatzschineria rhizosphaerae TaxID=2923279 RepID=A0ABY3X442_9GAMM|nr:hypothetical protein [Ignatzschineria rhizosphaerae]UNM97040.1 hypothetical protein MMG00_04085 [Ignatzschineria rhizosphaerae]